MPQPEASQVLVRVECSSLNPNDLRMVQGYGARLRRLAASQEFPFVSGHYVVGEVTKVGSAANEFNVGDWVIGVTDTGKMGAHAEYAAIDEKTLTPASVGISSNELATHSHVRLTTWTALVARLGIDPNQASGIHLFVHAGSGGVGGFVIQWAHSLGMRVSTTCGPSIVNWVKRRGADTDVNDATGDFRDEVRDVDYAYDTLGGENDTGTVALVKRGGGYVLIVHQLMPYTDQLGLVLGRLRDAGRVLCKKAWNGLLGRKYAWSICQPVITGHEHIIVQIRTGRDQDCHRKRVGMSGYRCGI